MGFKSNQMPANSEDRDQGKVKPFRTSTRLKLPPREEKPEDDSVYDRFLGAFERKEAPPTVNTENQRDKGTNSVETSLPSAQDIANLRPVEQRAHTNLITREAPNLGTPSPEGRVLYNQRFDIDRFIRDINKVYRLNGGESAVLRSLLEMSHAQGKDECEVTVPRVMSQTGLTEQRARRNLKSLRNKGWIHLVKEFDPYKHTAAIYKVSISPHK